MTKTNFGEQRIETETMLKNAEKSDICNKVQNLYRRKL